MSDVYGWWKMFVAAAHKAGTEALGLSKRPRNRDAEGAWWWNSVVQGAVKEKKQALKKWKQSKRAEDKELYFEAKRKAKKAVAVARREAYEELYEKLNTREGMKMVYKIAKQRERERESFQGHHENKIN